MGIVPFSSEEKFMKPCNVPKKFYALKNNLFYPPLVLVLIQELPLCDSQQ